MRSSQSGKSTGIRRCSPLRRPLSAQSLAARERELEVQLAALRERHGGAEARAARAERDAEAHREAARGCGRIRV